MLLALAASALAHTPHDATVYAASDPAGGAAPALITGFGRGRLWYGLRSPDGWGWSARLIEGWGDGVRSADWFPGGEVILATEGGGLLIGDGVFWTSAEGVPADEVLAVVRVSPDEPEVALVGGERLYRTGDGGRSWEALPLGFDGAVADLDWDPAGGGAACLITGLGGVFCTADGGYSWGERLALPAGLSELDIGEDGTLFIAGGELGLLVAPPGEQAVGAPLALDWVGGVEALPGGLVLVAGDTEIWRSTDNGASFHRVEQGLEPPGDGRGGPTDRGHYYRFLQGSDGAVLLAAWEGLHRSWDGGETWTQLPLVQPSFHARTQVVDAPEGPRVVMPSYGGGGMAWIDLQGRWAHLSSASLACCLRGGVLSPDFSRDGVGWLAERGNLWVTRDGGESWRDLSLDGAVDDVENMAVTRGADGPVMYFNGWFGESLDFAWSEDAGETWNRPGLGETVETDYLLDVAVSPDFASDGMAVVSAQGPVLLRSQAGASFQVWQRPPVEALRLVFSDPDTLWAATDDGLWRSRDGGALEQVALAGRLVTDVAFAADFPAGAAWAAVVDGVTRSLDGGETWSLLDGSPEGAVIDLAASGVEAGVVAAGGYGGVWVSEDAGDSWALASNRQRVDVSHQLWDLGGSWAVVGDVQGAFLRTAADAQSVGAAASLVFEGDEVGLLAQCGGGEGALEIQVDGGAIQRVSLEGPPGFQQIWCAALEPGWHTLTVTAAELPARLDGAEIRVADGLAGALCQAPQEAQGGCGCAGGGRGGGSAPALLGALLGALMLRRRPRS